MASWGEEINGSIRFRQTDSNSDFNGNSKSPLIYDKENVFSVVINSISTKLTDIEDRYQVYGLCWSLGI